MADKGFIKLDRKLLEWGWHDDESTFSLWIHMLLMCNYEDKEWHGNLIPKGSFITSYQHLAEMTGLSVSTVKRSIKKLEETGEITKESLKGHHTQIFINKWNNYQYGSKKGKDLNLTVNSQTDLRWPITKEDISKDISRNKEDSFSSSKGKGVEYEPPWAIFERRQ